MSDNDFKVGDRVQYTDEDGEVLVGIIVKLFPFDDDGQMVNFADVVWYDDNKSEPVALEFLEPEADETELEVEFKKVFEKHSQEIEDQLETAAKAITKAEKLSEKYGLPFHAQVSPLSQPYWPASFSTKFDGEGWRHSAFC